MDGLEMFRKVRAFAGEVARILGPEWAPPEDAEMANIRHEDGLSLHFRHEGRRIKVGAGLPDVPHHLRRYADPAPEIGFAPESSPERAAKQIKQRLLARALVWARKVRADASATEEECGRVRRAAEEMTAPLRDAGIDARVSVEDGALSATVYVYADGRHAAVTVCASSATFSRLSVPASVAKAVLQAAFA